ncbi:MAG: radical SAM protein [Bdellovibrionales bacterium]|nr:radical SAM protein [Bdellovibrionales bacterium]
MENARIYIAFKDRNPYLNTRIWERDEWYIVFAGIEAVANDRVLNTPGAFDEAWIHLRERAAERKELRAAYFINHETIGHFEAFIQEMVQHRVSNFYLAYSTDADVKPSVPLIDRLRKRFPEIRFMMDRDLEVAVGMALDQPLTMPRRAVIEIFNDCNLACDFCWTHSPYRNYKNPEGYFSRKLTKETIARYVEELAGFDVETVELCAVGDPLFHPDVWEIIDHIKSKGLRLRISTNGTLITKAKAERFIEIGVEQLFMNISAGDRDTYHRIHNVSPTIYDNLERNLKYLSDLREKTEKKYPYMQIINVITRENVDGLEKMIDFSALIRADFTEFRKVWIAQDFLKSVNFSKEKLVSVLAEKDRLLKKMKDLGLAGNLETFYQDVQTDLEDRNAGAVELVDFKAKPKPDKTEYGEQQGDYHEDPWNPPAQGLDPEIGAIVPCSISQHFTLIDVNSDLRYCCMGDKIHSPYGTIKEQWLDARYQSFRKFWKKRYADGGNICRGCPHVGENRHYQEVLERLGLVEMVREGVGR